MVNTLTRDDALEKVLNDDNLNFAALIDKHANTILNGKSLGGKVKASNPGSNYYAPVEVIVNHNTELAKSHLNADDMYKLDIKNNIKEYYEAQNNKEINPDGLEESFKKALAGSSEHLCSRNGIEITDSVKSYALIIAHEVAEYAGRAIEKAEPLVGTTPKTAGTGIVGLGIKGAENPNPEKKK